MLETRIFDPDLSEHRILRLTGTRGWVNYSYTIDAGKLVHCVIGLPTDCAKDMKGASIHTLSTDRQVTSFQSSDEVVSFIGRILGDVNDQRVWSENGRIYASFLPESQLACILANTPAPLRTCPF